MEILKFREKERKLHPNQSHNQFQKDSSIKYALIGCIDKRIWMRHDHWMKQIGSGNRPAQYDFGIFGCITIYYSISVPLHSLEYFLFFFCWFNFQFNFRFPVARYRAQEWMSSAGHFFSLSYQKESICFDIRENH